MSLWAEGRQSPFNTLSGVSVVVLSLFSCPGGQSPEGVGVKTLPLRETAEP